MKHSVPAVIAKLSALTIFLCGCDAHSPQQKPVTPEETAAISKDPVFFLGQTISDIRRLLGEPNGTIKTGNQTILLYGRESLKFVDEIWINPLPDIRERIEAGRKAAAEQAATQTPRTKKRKSGK